MAALFEADQIGKRESLADLIANVEVQGTPFSSMVAKRKKPNQVVHDWQVKAYPETGHKGVVDGQDATNFTHNPRKRVHGVSQKTWHNPAVSDFAEESVVAGVPEGEMASQIADALVTVKRQIEKRCLSNSDCALDDGSSQGNETRGLGSWIDSAAQGVYPVDADFRTPAASIYSGAVADLTETEFQTMCQSAYKQRKGPSKLHGYVGVELKNQISNYTRYETTVSGKNVVRQFNQNAKDKAVVTCIDKLVMDTGEIDLFLVPFLYTDADTGADTAYTHKSGLFVDMSMCGLAYTRLPRVKRLEYKGGGYKAIVDAIFLLMLDNPLGHMKAEVNS